MVWTAGPFFLFPLKMPQALYSTCAVTYNLMQFTGLARIELKLIFSVFIDWLQFFQAAGNFAETLSAAFSKNAHLGNFFSPQLGLVLFLWRIPRKRLQAQFDKTARFEDVQFKLPSASAWWCFSLFMKRSWNFVAFQWMLLQMILFAGKLCLGQKKYTNFINTWGHC